MKIFYSWQSDLPNSSNRSFIQECIDKVVKKYQPTLKIEADRDTVNKTGSPDIANTIFEKIEECDIFVADISIVNASKCKLFGRHLRPTPNPNVLLELGYAACKLGWDRIICLYNTDYASLDVLPFDLRHRRITPYSLKGKTKADERKRIVEIISETIEALSKTGNLERPKGSYAQHTLLGFNAETRTVSPNIFLSNPLVSVIRADLIDECKSLIFDISACGVHMPTESELRLIKSLSGLSIYGDWSPITIEKEEQNEVRAAIQNILGTNLDASFFYLGNLKKRTRLLADDEYSGSDNEIAKYKKYTLLKRQLSQICVLDLFAKSFDEIYVLPLVIRNTSKISDRNIHLTLQVIGEHIEAVSPTTLPIDEELQSSAGFICDYGLIPALFLFDGNHNIKYDDIEVRDYTNNNPHVNLWDACSSNDPDSYIDELKDYIAVPFQNNVYEFKIKSLQANETKWIDKMILVKPRGRKVKIEYTLTSDNSDGSVAGTIIQK